MSLGAIMAQEQKLLFPEQEMDKRSKRNNSLHADLVINQTNNMRSGQFRKMENNMIHYLSKQEQSNLQEALYFQSIKEVLPVITTQLPLN